MFRCGQAHAEISHISNESIIYNNPPAQKRLQHGVRSGGEHYTMQIKMLNIPKHKLHKHTRSVQATYKQRTKDVQKTGTWRRKMRGQHTAFNYRRNSTLPSQNYGHPGSNVSSDMCP